MRKIFLSGLFLACGFMVANACHYPVLVNEGTWVNGIDTHFYKVFEYLPASTDLDREWTTAAAFNYTAGDATPTTGWTLAGITSAAEQAEIQSLMFDTRNPTAASTLAGEYWLGGKQNPLDAIPATANWEWITGEGWGYTNWYGGEPNDYNGKESYLGMWSNDKWQWNDEGSTGNISGFIAERIVTRSVPEPASVSLILIGMLSLFGLNLKRKRR
jgi:hypothetical protein